MKIDIDFDGRVPVEQLGDLPKEPGVYFVCDSNDNAMYIGCSINIFNRWKWKSHPRYPQVIALDGAYVSWKLFSDSDLEPIEKEYIEQYCPEWNRTKYVFDPKQVTVRLDEDQHGQLKAIQERDGVPIAESVRRAVDMYLRHWGKLEQVEQETAEQSQP